MTPFRFALANQVIVISAESAELLSHFRDYFRYYPAADEQLVSTTPVTLHLQHAVSVESVSAAPRAGQLLAQTGQVSLWQCAENPDQYWLLAPATQFVIDLKAACCTANIAPPALHWPHILTNTYALFALLLLLRQRGVYHLHAAALRDPNERTVLLCGAQRSGKTTLTTALSLAGWQPLADDSILLYAQAGAFGWEPLRKQFHLASELLTRWPSLSRSVTLARGDGRVCLDALTHFGAGELANGSFAQVDYLLFPFVTNAVHSQLVPLNASEALPILVTESVYFPLWPNHTRQQFEWLTQLVKGARCYRLLAGQDVLLEPEQLAARSLRHFANDKHLV